MRYLDIPGNTVYLFDGFFFAVNYIMEVNAGCDCPADVDAEHKDDG